MGLAGLFDVITGRESPRRFRRKDAKVGENFDDYFVHAPRRAVEGPRQLAVPYLDPKQRSFDRPRSRDRGSVTWKRASSAPRSLSELNESHVRGEKSRTIHHVNSPRSRSNLSALHQNRQRQPVAQLETPQPSGQHVVNPALPSPRSPSKKRPQPLIITDPAHGFAAGGPREMTFIAFERQKHAISPAIPQTSPHEPVHPATPTSANDSAAPSASSSVYRTSSPTSPYDMQLPPCEHRRDSLSITRPGSKRSLRRVPSDKRSSQVAPLASSTTRQVVDNDLFALDEVQSVSSLGETDSPSAVAARHGIFPADTVANRRSDTLEVCEDFFVFGSDSAFADGGFEISRNGRLEIPGTLKRKSSSGTLVDGVPKSSNNFIFVRSLAEFSRGSTLSKDSALDSTLGAGSAGRVSLAIHRPSNRKIAVKRINVYDKDKRTQLLKELETLMSYDSRFLVRSYGAFYDFEGVVHVTLEYMDKGALSDVLEVCGNLPEEIISHIIEHCLRGLMFLHDNHVLHRDLKTSNVLLSGRVCRAKLSDFGLARDLNPGVSKVDSFVGTLAYMSPERLHGSEYTYASDIWGLGICAAECYLGRYPFDNTQSFFDYVEAAQSNPATLLVGASAECVDFVCQCTNPDPHKRPPARDLLQHAFITQKKKDINVFREWLDGLPKTHSGGGLGDEPAFSEQMMRKYREKACALDRRE